MRLKITVQALSLYVKIISESAAALASLTIANVVISNDGFHNVISTDRREWRDLAFKTLDFSIALEMTT